MRSPTLLLMRMNAADTRASRAIADCTPLTVVSRSATTAEIETFISDVSKTSTNIAAASNSPSRETDASVPSTSVCAAVVTGRLRHLREAIVIRLEVRTMSRRSPSFEVLSVSRSAQLGGATPPRDGWNDELDGTLGVRQAERRGRR